MQRGKNRLEPKRVKPVQIQKIQTKVSETGPSGRSTPGSQLNPHQRSKIELQILRRYHKELVELVGNKGQINSRAE